MEYKKSLRGRRNLPRQKNIQLATKNKQTIKRKWKVISFYGCFLLLSFYSLTLASSLSLSPSPFSSLSLSGPRIKLKVIAQGLIHSLNNGLSPGRDTNKTFHKALPMLFADFFFSSFLPS